LTVYENGKLTKFPYINDKNDYFNDFAVDDNGIAWFASQKGIVRFQNGHYYRYTKNEGLTSGFYSKLYLTGNDRLLCLGNKGVIVFQKRELKKAKSLSITLETKEGKSITDKIIELNHDSDFGITADVINFSKSEYILEYRLNNDEWTKLEGNTVDFSNFSSGNFTLQFRARYYFSDWSYSSTVTIDKVSPWYFRWYVLASGIVLVLIVVFGIVNLRFKRLRERNQKLQDLLDSNQKLENQLTEMRHNIAQDFHDELGNKLAGITVMSDQLLHTEKLKDSDDYAVVERINKDSQDLFQGIRDFIWAIDSKNGSLEELIFALTDFGEELFQYSGIKFIVENEVEEAKLLLPHYWNRQLLLLFKEAMTNSFKYSQAKTGTLIFKVEENNLYIEFKDDGTGFDPKTITRRNGLFNLQKRADKLNGQLVINSFAGTSIVFIGKLE
jgi:signal transduction histidine kinase